MREKSHPAPAPGSAARLGEGDEAAGARVASLNQIVPFGLDSKGLFDEGNQVFPGPEGVSEIGLEIPKRQGRSCPSAVRRRRLQSSQKLWLMGVMTPTVPWAPGNR